jgi:hypothetical protein
MITTTNPSAAPGEAQVVSMIGGVQASSRTWDILAGSVPRADAVPRGCRLEASIRSWMMQVTTSSSARRFRFVVGAGSWVR